MERARTRAVTVLPGGSPFPRAYMGGTPNEEQVETANGEGIAMAA